MLGCITLGSYAHAGLPRQTANAKNCCASRAPCESFPWPRTYCWIRRTWARISQKSLDRHRKLPGWRQKKVWIAGRLGSGMARRAPHPNHAVPTPPPPPGPPPSVPPTHHTTPDKPDRTVPPPPSHILPQAPPTPPTMPCHTRMSAWLKQPLPVLSFLFFEARNRKLTADVHGPVPGPPPPPPIDHTVPPAAPTKPSKPPPGLKTLKP